MATTMLETEVVRRVVFYEDLSRPLKELLKITAFPIQSPTYVAYIDMLEAYHFVLKFPTIYKEELCELRESYSDMLWGSLAVLNEIGD